MRTFRADEAAVAAGAELIGNPGTVFSGISYDSRSVRQDNLFVAVKGEKSDGGDFIDAAFVSGAAAVMSSRRVSPPEGRALLLVSSPEDGVRRLARSARDDFKGTVIGVVGSAGKTTTKDFSSKLLSLLGPTFATGGNRNNLLGLPEMILNADDSAKFWVLEMGISKPDEMEMLAPVASPNIVLFTSIRPVHTEFFSSLKAIKSEKAKVLNYSTPPSLYIFNADDELLAELPGEFGGKHHSYGCSPNAGLRIINIEGMGEKGFAIGLSYKGEEISVVIPFLNKVQCFNFAAALALALALGAPLSLAREVIPSLSPAAHRGVPHYLKDGILLYDDSYNSNPEALSALIGCVSGWNRRLVGVLGEMKELGAGSEKYHAEAGRRAGETLSSLLCVGGEGASAMSFSFGASGKPCFRADRWEDGYDWLKRNIAPADAVIVKGSRSIGLDKLVDRFLIDYPTEGSR